MTSSKSSRFTVSTRGTLGTEDRLTVLTEDRSAEVAATTLVNDLRSNGFELRGDGTILSIGSSSTEGVVERYKNSDMGDFLSLDSYESDQLRDSFSADGNERYIVQRAGSRTKVRKGESLSRERDSVDEVLHVFDIFDEETLGGSGVHLELNSILGNDSSTDRETSNQHDNSTISTKETKSANKMVAISLAGSTLNGNNMFARAENGEDSHEDNYSDNEGYGSQKSNSSQKETSTFDFSTVFSTVGESTKRLTWGGEMPPLTSYGSRVPETVSKHFQIGINQNVSDLSSGPNVSISSLKNQDSIGRFAEQFLVALRLAVVSPCGKS